MKTNNAKRKKKVLRANRPGQREINTQPKPLHDYSQLNIPVLIWFPVSDNTGGRPKSWPLDSVVPTLTQYIQLRCGSGTACIGLRSVENLNHSAT